VTHGEVRTIAIEHEDPFEEAETGIPEAAAVLAGAVHQVPR
jgi:hypothetical protein